MSKCKSLLSLVSQYDGFYSKPPMDHLKFYFNQYELISLNNDGGEVWFGRSDKWYFFMSHPEFRSVIFWYLRTWAFKDLFGLRTWVYYKLLTHECNRHREYFKLSQGKETGI